MENNQCWLHYFIKCLLIHSQFRITHYEVLDLQPSASITAKQANSHGWFAQGAEVNEEEKNTDQFRKLLIQRRWKMLKVSMKNIC